MTDAVNRVRVLFVCLGNICRSPMAEAVFASRVRAAGLADRIAMDSAGTGHWHVGQPPHRGTLAILATNGIGPDNYRHRARQITLADLDHFDYILTMDDANRDAVARLGPGRARVHAFLDFAPESGVREVPDPYYSGNFGEVYDLVSAAADGLLATIRRERDL